MSAISKAPAGAIVLLTFILYAGLCNAVRLGENTSEYKDFDDDGTRFCADKDWTDARQPDLGYRKRLTAVESRLTGHNVELIPCCKLIETDGWKCGTNPKLAFEWRLGERSDVEKSKCGACKALTTGCNAVSACQAEHNEREEIEAPKREREAKIKEEQEKMEAEKKEKEAKIKEEQEKIEAEKKAQKEAQEKALEELKRKEGEEAARQEAERLKKEKVEWLQANCKPYSNIECSSWTATNLASEYSTSNGCPLDQQGITDCNTEKEVNSKYLCTCKTEGQCYDGEKAGICIDPEDYFAAKGPAMRSYICCDSLGA